MLTPTEKADELYVGYWYLTNNSIIAKQCALIAVDEVLKMHLDRVDEWFGWYDNLMYWQEVKTEIEKKPK